MIWYFCFVKYKTSTPGTVSESISEPRWHNCIYRGKTCMNFCVPAQCMAALQDYDQRNSNYIGESREGDFPQGKLSKMQPPPYQFNLQDCNHQLLTQNWSEIVAGKQHCNSSPALSLYSGQVFRSCERQICYPRWLVILRVYKAVQEEGCSNKDVGLVLWRATGAA